MFLFRRIAPYFSPWQISSRFSSEQEAPAGSVVFRNAGELAIAAKQWPAARLVEVWNQLPGAKPVRKFTDRTSGVRRLWEAVQAIAVKGGPQRRKPASKPVAAPVTAKPSKRGRTAGEGTKTEKILGLLRQPSGATLPWSETLQAASYTQ